MTQEVFFYGAICIIGLFILLLKVSSPQTKQSTRNSYYNSTIKQKEIEHKYEKCFKCKKDYKENEMLLIEVNNKSGNVCLSCYEEHKRIIKSKYY